MRIAVYPHDLGIGGSQLNAIEIAAGVRDLGHHPFVVGRPGALVERIHELGLEFVEDDGYFGRIGTALVDRSTIRSIKLETSVLTIPQTLMGLMLVDMV